KTNEILHACPPSVGGGRVSTLATIASIRTLLGSSAASSRTPRVIIAAPGGTPGDGRAQMAVAGRREFLISKAWIQAVVLVVVCGFFVLGLLAYRTYVAHPPVPTQVVGPTGNVLFTGSDVSRGQQAFLNHGLMEYGSVFGHGAYLGPDYTADYLRREANIVRRIYGGSSSDAAVQKTIDDLRANRY